MEPRILFTGQHLEMLEGIADPLDLDAYHRLTVMKKGQSLNELSASLLTALQGYFEKDRPDLVVVQGDTTSSFMGALAAYHQKIPVVHVEAGLRTGDNYAPFPEEVNRKGIAQIAELHFAPTRKAFDQLKSEGHTSVHLTGNTVVDAIQKMRQKMASESMNEDTKQILVTTHRREAEEQGLRSICKALKQIATANNDVLIKLPMHLNPMVRKVIQEELSDAPRIDLVEPLSYPEMVKALERSWLLITDSGGLQEEAPAFNLPVLVLREKSERMEAVEAGSAILCGTDEKRIVTAFEKLYQDQNEYDKMASAPNPFGDGLAGIRITEIIAHHFSGLIDRT